MPPYLTGCPKAGLVEYASSILTNTSLPVIYYNRANGILGTNELAVLAERHSNLIGLKDGVGDIASLNDAIRSIGDRLVYIGGVPTAEMYAEAYLAIGVNTYSSAVFNFVPELALQFYNALRAGDRETTKRIIQEFFIPFCRLRDRETGYGVSLIKAGARAQGYPAGDVRPPLTMPTPEEFDQLQRIIDAIG